MPLPTPQLDTRSYDELVAEARALIPLASPRWTDHNAHDPGITLVELLAWLTEQLLFRSDRTTPAARRAFLRLVDVQPRPAGVASTVVALRRPPGGSGVLQLAQGLQVTTTDASRVFESTAPLAVSPAWLELDPGESTRRGVIETLDGGVAQDAQHPFHAFGAAPGTGAALRLGFEELPASPGDELVLHCWVRGSADSASEADRVPVERPDVSHHDVRTVWEYHAGPDDWRPLAVADRTRAFTLSGFVTLRGPVSHPIDAASGRYWIRCRLASGTYDCPPMLDAIATNAVEVRDSVRHGPEELGALRGSAWEAFTLAKRPVEAGSTRLRIVGASGGVDDGWREVTEWDLSGPEDRHYRLDPTEGTVTFGNGRVGRVAPAGGKVTALEYRVSGDVTGNLPAGRLTRLPAVAVEVMQPFRASGGTPAEPLERAHGRALRVLARRARGVTLEDLESLACETPGVRLGRARAVPGYHPDFGCLPADGVVTLIVIPACGQPPVPSRGLLKAVSRYVDRRRILATELHVVGPRYVPVAISATLHVARGSSGAGAQGAIALERFLDPLRGGEDGTGWPFGRPVAESEVMALLGGLEGVAYADGVGITGAEDARPRCGSLSLCPIELPASGQHRISVKEL